MYPLQDIYYFQDIKNMVIETDYHLQSGVFSTRVHVHTTLTVKVIMYLSLMDMANLIKMFENRILCPSCPDSDCDSDCEDDCYRHYHNTHSERELLEWYLEIGLRVPDHLLIEASNTWYSNYFTKTMAIVKKYQKLPQVVEARYISEGGYVSD